MSFPQGGDFSRAVDSLFKVISSDRRICQHDNGTIICDQGHKLKFPGSCINQPIGTFNSTDEDFQPDFPVCVSDYESSGFSPGILFSLSDKTTSGKVVSYDDISGFGTVVPITNTFQQIYKFVNKDIVISGNTHFLYHFSNFIVSSSFLQDVPEGVSTFWKMPQFNPGVVPHWPNTTSDTLFPLDVYSSFISYKSLTFFFIETLAASLKQSGDIDSSNPVIQTDRYSTISGSEDFCVGDEVAPFITLHDPTTSGLSLRPQDQIVDISISDPTAGVDKASIFITLYSSDREDIDLVTAGTAGSGVSIIGDQSSYRITYTPPFSWNFNEDVRVTISGSDLPPTVDGNPFFCGTNEVNHLSTELDFKVLNYNDITASITVDVDSTPPYISSSSPASGTSDNNIFSPVTISIADDITGVNLSTVVVSIGGEVVVNNGVSTSEETVIVGDSDEYTITYSPENPFTYGDSITVTVHAEDNYGLSPNVLDTSYDFSYTDQGTLIIENFLPAVGTTRNLPDTDIQVDIRDDSYGVDGEESVLIVNGTTVSGTYTPLVSGTRISYHPPNNFDYGQPIDITVHAVNGNSISPVVKDIQYKLYYGYNVTYFNEEKFEHDKEVDVFVQAKNTSPITKYLTTGYPFTAYTYPSSDLTATIEAINPKSDISASITPIAPEHRYGETVIVEIFVKDFEGNQLGPITYSYTIENKP